MPNLARTLLASLAFAALAGCGQMGPLYLPDEDPAGNEPGAPSEVAPPPADA